MGTEKVFVYHAMPPSKSKHQPIPGHEKTTYNPDVGRWNRDEERILDWISERQYRTGKIELVALSLLLKFRRPLSGRNAAQSQRVSTNLFDEITSLHE